MPEQETPRDPRLKPAYGLRAADLPRSCNTCAMLQVGDATHYCLRPDGPAYEAGSMEEWFNVCERWRKIK